MYCNKLFIHVLKLTKRQVKKCSLVNNNVLHHKTLNPSCNRTSLTVSSQSSRKKSQD